MPTLDWLNKAQALTAAAQVPYRPLEPQSVHGQQCLVGTRSKGTESRSEATVIGRIWSRDLLISLQDISLH